MSILFAMNLGRKQSKRKKSLKLYQLECVADWPTRSQTTKDKGKWQGTVQNDSVSCARY